MAVENTISALNAFPQRNELFSGDADASSALEQLRKGKRTAYRMRSPGDNPSSSSQSDHPILTISHEPLGEAIISYQRRGVEMINPRIVSSTIRFVTPDVALADGSFTYADENANSQTTPLLFVMRKEGGDWKIVSVRLLAR
jgi:hypothetical protein